MILFVKSLSGSWIICLLARGSLATVGARHIEGLSRRLYGSSFSLAAWCWIRTLVFRFRGIPPNQGYFASKSFV